jgi:mannose-1-phosphate guanylyltransferase
MKQGTQAAILCGGRGERLKPLTDYFQKVMIPIGPKKLPLLAYIVALMRHYGVTKIALLTGYRSEDIKRYFGDGTSQKVKISYSEDRAGVTGSLNAVASAIKGGAIGRCDELIFYYGDILTDLNIAELLKTHRSAGADVTLVLDKGYTLPVGVAEVRDGIVTSFKEKPRVDMSVTTGPMVVGPMAMQLMTKVAGRTKSDLMTHFIPAVLKRGGKVAAYYTTNHWFDVGTVSSFVKLNDELAEHPLSYHA